MTQVRKSMLCPRCGKLISVNAESCIHCGMKNPGALRRVPFLQNALSGKISYVSGIVTACIVLYVLAILRDPRAIFQATGFFNFLSPSGQALYDLGMTGAQAVRAGRWWTVITAIYLHGGILHIVFNLLWIRQLGPEVESLYGSSRFFLIFTISGIIGFLASNLFNIAFTIGASGSIFGLLGAVVYYGRHRGGTYGTLIYRQTIQWVIILFVLGFLMSFVNNAAHAGGFIGGYVSAMLLGYREHSQESLLHRRLALASLTLTILAFGMVAFTLLAGAPG